MEFYWLEKTIMLPVRRLCRGLASRLSFRKQRSIMMLSQEVQACEYEDVRIMWEMLQKTESGTRAVPRSPTWMKNNRFRNVFAWARWSKTF
ncbi:hypothetical protein RND81_01G083500 [Saponaria officinalis]|uniref:Uncharacterized protein n=1 Tax=Saponaria officinalis TaxID=3572 RepID=A0AAW1NDY2_SAPOF